MLSMVRTEQTGKLYYKQKSWKVSDIFPVNPEVLIIRFNVCDV